MNPLRMVQRVLAVWREHQLQRSDYHRGPHQSDAKAIFVLGCGRSGTTLLRGMLERHPRLWGGPESGIFVRPVDPRALAEKFLWNPERALRIASETDSAVSFAERFFGEQAKEAGKDRWVEKTPKHVVCLGYLLGAFPNGRFIHVIRDGRDVACSLRNHPKAAFRDGKIIPLNTNNPISKCIDRWVDDTAAGLSYRGHPRVLEVRYEDLVGDPERTIRAVCSFVGEEYDAACVSGDNDAKSIEARMRTPNNMSSYGKVGDASVGRWRRDLSSAELETCLRKGGPLLEALGYWNGRDRT
jgi:hypothetical protein